MKKIMSQEKLISDYNLILIQNNPREAWVGQYLKCPICHYFVYKGPGYDKCKCGNISIDSDMLRVTVEHDENGVEEYKAIKKK